MKKFKNHRDLLVHRILEAQKSRQAVFKTFIRKTFTKLNFAREKMKRASKVQGVLGQKLARQMRIVKNSKFCYESPTWQRILKS